MGSNTPVTAMDWNCHSVLPGGIAMRGRRRRRRFLEFRNHQLLMLRHWQYHSRLSMEFDAELSTAFAGYAAGVASQIVKAANALTESDWEILLK